jgi:hypothetical protein
MHAVWKFRLSVGREPQRVSMPRGATVLSVHEQYGDVCLWAYVEPAKPSEDRLFEVVGTGWDLPPADRRHVGTAHIDNGRLVFHVFERTP